ncbi:asparaginase [Ponticoccus sp. SC2-23]|uniref:asparaginase n=1 Tax=Alexandriicola marinus TaxID=2081710 RepID=UPI000FDC3C6C|nr:asparaginase [Alexandriicola marinus]MBM1218586.1 asparaginase [Ponticoccus sp. SC6-9]MBM1224342.1 asparaginase [Ponticoccus sp. SC6-15]MBM1229879.1 asparaginase [Ponticoccus sp. SC6-38]MBM1233308.1 asparaginase [Ponticoccus sp. SC6-45]MBM1236742.1 asparaginase [Ponticoccus sp. SC6-49]MBM1242319.1 asparaginase [Ponticoccus sp. SC2-64]MBM1246832.1 asparaginase [Ponticoccus sp. SC6-42]MBM1251310.1 asparaginase [Ponticoccus sp. SC6-33]MBM1254751.1 asparaginase [Ponticoccus sp. SC6-60]MBM1
MTDTLPEIALILLGGTITMTKDTVGGIVPSLSAEALIEAVPGLSEVAHVTPSSPFRIPGASLTLPQLGQVAAAAQAAVAAGASGVIVVQGTDTIEETAFALDCLWSLDAPLVVTGAMRGPEAAGADGPANLLSAAIAAASPELRGRGVTVVMNDQVHAAEYVAKTHTGLCSAFRSIGPGPMGEVFEGRLHVLASVARQARTLPLPGDSVPPVALFKPGLGEDARLLSVLPDLGYAGVVVEGMGAGHVAEVLSEPLGQLAVTMPVILASRTGDGPVFQRTYGFNGSETDLIGRGLIPAGRLPAIKARLLLQLLLSAGAAHTDIRAAFD